MFDRSPIGVVYAGLRGLLDGSPRSRRGSSLPYNRRKSFFSALDPRGALVTLWCLLLAATACSDGRSVTAPTSQPEQARVADVSIGPEELADSVELAVGDSVQLFAEAVDSNGNPVTTKVRWSSSHEAVASVDEDGLVKGLSAGDATIYAQAANLTDSTAVSVVDDGSSTTTTSDDGSQTLVLSVSPDSFSIEAGQTQQLEASVTDGDGNPVDTTVTWSTSDSSVATVDSTGLVTGEAAGDVLITATAEDASDSSAGTITEATTTSSSDDTSLPGTVTDLAVDASQTTHDGVTLTFTQVDDGTGEPADYDVRFMESPISWGSATSVSQGTCTVPLQGTEIGTTMTCTVEGLRSGTSYDFQVVAFRGTMNDDAVYGELSNVATEATKSLVVSVTPSSFEIEVGQTQQLEASVTDEDGNPVDLTVTWSTSNSSVATVDASGLVTGEGVGDATITAKVEDASDSSAATVTESTSSDDDNGSTTSSDGGSHEPSGLTKITERPWDTFDEDGWGHREDGRYSIVSDDKAPKSPSSVGQMRYPGESSPGACDGLMGGTAPGNTSRTFANTSELYIHFWIKISDPFQGHDSGVNKIIFLFNVDENDEKMYLLARGKDNNSLRLNVNAIGQYNDNVASGALTRGRWHEVEAHLVMNTPGVKDGQLHIWLDGTKIAEHTNVEYSASGEAETFDNIRWNPTWGGTGDCLEQNQYMWMDHVYVSGK